MLAAFQRGSELCAVRWTGRVRLHAGVISYCEQQADAAQGVLQVPDKVFSDNVSYQLGATKLKPCPRCRVAILASISG
jgi:hypothetical protein